MVLPWYFLVMKPGNGTQVVSHWGIQVLSGSLTNPDLISWLVVEPTPLKNMSSSVWMMTFPIYGKIKFMFQTTNQWRKSGQNLGAIHSEMSPWRMTQTSASCFACVSFQAFLWHCWIAIAAHFQSARPLMQGSQTWSLGKLPNVAMENPQKLIRE